MVTMIIRIDTCTSTRRICFPSFMIFPSMASLNGSGFIRRLFPLYPTIDWKVCLAVWVLPAAEIRLDHGLPVYLGGPAEPGSAPAGDRNMPVHRVPLTTQYTGGMTSTVVVLITGEHEALAACMMA